jgi:hypothetical protein
MRADYRIRMKIQMDRGDAGRLDAKNAQHFAASLFGADAFGRVF